MKSLVGFHRGNHMKSFLCAALTIGFIGNATADESLSIGKCLEILSGLNQMDHYEDQGKVRQYKLGGTTRLTIALNIGALRPVADAADKVRLGMVADLNEKSAGAADQMRATLEYQESMKAPCNITLGHIKLVDLKIGDGPDENQIPPSAIASIMSILDR